MGLIPTDIKPIHVWTPINYVTRIEVFDTVRLIGFEEAAKATW